MKPSDTGEPAALRWGQTAWAALYWTAPAVACLILYWHGLQAWFAADDFAWLKHSTEIYAPGDLFRSLFAPEAQGTIRPWSERGFFLVFYWLFGLNALPFRIWVFFTQFANLALIMAITRRLSGSRAAAVCAALLWTANSSLAIVMSWTSPYNQAMCAFFLLAAFYFLLRWLESGRRKDWLMQWLMYLIGFGAMELNVLYPVLAAAYTFLCARKHFRRTLPLFIPAVLFAVAHRMAAQPASGVYAMHFDASMWTTLRTYWQWMLGASSLALVMRLPKWGVSVYNLALTVTLLVVVVGNARRRNWLPLFLLLWFVVLIAPVLPLRDHRTEYYPFLPAIGVAMLSACSLAAAWRKRAWWRRAISLAAPALYLAASLPITRITTEWYYQRSRSIQKLVLGVARAHELHPQKVILLDGLQSLLFWSAVVDRPFPLVGADNVYLTPGSESRIESHPELGDPAEFVMPPGAVWHAIESDEAVVYSVRGDRLRNITTTYARSIPDEWESAAPARIDVGNPAVGYLLGREWYAADGGHRWMPRRATLRIAGPRQAGASLHLSGWTPPVDLSMQLVLTADGIRLPARSLKGSDAFDLTVPLPSEVAGRASMEIVLEVDRTIKVPNDPRDFGLNFGVIEVRP